MAASVLGPTLVNLIEIQQPANPLCGTAFTYEVVMVGLDDELLLEWIVFDEVVDQSIT